MCGIVASINYSFDTNTVNRIMGHRGPDEQNGILIDNIQFYHLRLSILDISTGQQPMQYLNRYTIVYNGEIYNYKDVKAKYNLICKTNSDTEVILQMFHKLGKEMLNEFDGMFAFIIYDSVEKKLFLSRDRAGKKPLYLFKKNNAVFIASELNCIKATCDVTINQDAIATYFRTGMYIGKDTCYNEVYEIPKGSFSEIDCNSLSIKENLWWNILDYYNQETDYTYYEAKEKVKEGLTNAIKRRIESSDVEVGTFLSGGIDSGLITAYAAQFNTKIKTFTVSFPGIFNEAPTAEKVAQKFNTQHHTISLDFNHLESDVEKILFYYGEPFFDSSAIPSYYVCKEAAKHVKVVLNGDGADELFAGYRRFVPFSKYNFYENNVLIKFLSQIGYPLIPHSKNKMSKTNYIKRLLFLAKANGVESYLRSATDIFEGFEKEALIHTNTIGVNVLEKIINNVNSSKCSTLSKSLYLDYEVNLFSNLLVKMDIASMANSIEGRSPFLCKELQELAPTISNKFKINGNTTKFILRELAKDELPDNISNLPKRGFEIPLNNWVKTIFHPMIQDFLADNNAVVYNYVNKSFIEKLTANKISISEEKKSKILWSILCFEIWHKNVMRINNM